MVFEITGSTGHTTINTTSGDEPPDTPFDVTSHDADVPDDTRFTVLKAEKEDPTSMDPSVRRYVLTVAFAPMLPTKGYLRT